MSEKPRYVTHWGFLVDFDVVTKLRPFCRHRRIALGTRLILQSKMEASSVNNTMANEISKKIDKFYGKLEMKYYSAIQSEDVPQKLAVQDLFEELVVLKEQAMKSHSEANLREKLKFKKCDLRHMACSEVSYWKKTLI